jgi:hypothetical protein
MPFPLFVFATLDIAATTAIATLLFARHQRLSALTAIAGATALLVFHAAYFDLFADDGYITLRYSNNFAQGLGPVWNPGERVEGYTSFSWMALLAVMAKLGFDLVFAARLLALLASIGTFWAMYRLWRLWSREEPESGIGHPLALVAPLLGLAIADALPYWGFSGMETALFMALICGSACLYLHERRAGGFPWSALMLVAAAMTRPEGAVPAAVTGAFIAFDAVRATDRPRAFQRALFWAALFAIPFGIYFSWRWAYYGFFFPNTFYAKVGFTTASIDRGLEYIADAGVHYHLVALFAGLGVLYAASRRLRGDAAYIAALTGAMLAAIVIEGHSDGHGRFIAPLLPLLLLGGVAGFAMLAARARLQPALAAAVPALALTLGGLALLPGSRDPLLTLGRQAIDDRSALGVWFNEHTPEDYTIADFMIGAIAYHAEDRNILDLLGLNDVVIAHTDIPTMGEGVAGHEKYNAEYVFEDARPEIIVAGKVTASRPLTANEVRAAVIDGSLIEASSAIFSDPRLWDDYQVRAAKIDGRWYHFFQRIDTVEQLHVEGLR